MPGDDPLFIPLELRAFVVNDAVRTGGAFQRDGWDYDLLAKYQSPEPPPFGGASTAAPATGVILHWTLPPALRSGEQSAVDGSISYPLAPNRWLVVRTSGPAGSRRADGWVVESDYLNPTDGAAPFVNPVAGTPTRIGRTVVLGRWTEPNPAKLFLSAVAPGNPTFATFQPFCPDVFSMHDPLTGVADDDTLGYLVAGWYSQSQDDFLGRWVKDPNTTFQQFLKSNGWTIDPTSGSTATSAVYHGTVIGVAWHQTGPAPPPPAPIGSIPLAVGDTAVDALTALLRAQAGPANVQLDDTLLEALQYGLLSAQDQPDAHFELPEQIERSWFGARDGGVRWEIVDAPPAGGGPPPAMTPAERATEDAWLAHLNEHQLELDTAIREAADLQEEVYGLWFKDGLAANLPQYPPSAPKAKFREAFDDTDPASTISRLNEALKEVDHHRKHVPSGRTQAQLEQAIAQYAADHGLAAHRRLRQRAATPFALANDPVVLMAGLQMDAELVPPGPQRCRFASELVTGITFRGAPITVADMDGKIAAPAGLAGIAPATAATALVDELFFLDAINATQIASVALGTTDPQTIQALAQALAGHQATLTGELMPALGLGGWSQPWSPLVLLWCVEYVPILHEAGGKVVWEFDGNAYDWNGEAAAVGMSLPCEGTIFLSGQACFNFRAQLMNYLQLNPDAEGAKALQTFIQMTDGWHFISQSLSGFTQQLLRRHATPYMSVSTDSRRFFGKDTLAGLLGDQATYPPSPGEPGATGNDPTGFQPWRAGQIAFARLSVLDRFGQRLEVVTDANSKSLAPIASPNLHAQKPVSAQNPERYLQLQPRLLQPGRLEVDFVSAADDGDVLGEVPGVNPVCGWLLHNYLDQTIVAYDEAGTLLGAIWLSVAVDDPKVVWRPSPSSLYPTLQDLINAPRLKHLGQFLQGIETGGADAFDALMRTLDDRSFTVAASEPPADRALAMLAGRPLALVRTRLRFTLRDAPERDPSWRFTFDPASPHITSYTFPIRLGEQARRDDALVGYFADDNYATMRVPAIPTGLPKNGYLREIGNGADLALAFDGTTRRMVSMLVDVDAKVHATTGILPIVSFALPDAFIGESLRRMHVTFAIGPLLADAEIDLAGRVAAVRLPRPVEASGTWDWVEPVAGGTWQSAAVTPAPVTADLDNVAPELRSGLLRLHGALDE